MLRERLIFPDLKRRVVAEAERHAADAVLIEDTGSGSPLIQDFQTEVLQFPRGRYDDQVDSLSQFLMWITKPRHYGPQIRSL